MEDTSEKDNPENDIPEEETVENIIPEKDNPDKENPKEGVPGKEIPREGIPEKDNPEKDILEKNTEKYTPTLKNTTKELGTNNENKDESSPQKPSVEETEAFYKKLNLLPRQSKDQAQKVRPEDINVMTDADKSKITTVRKSTRLKRNKNLHRFEDFQYDAKRKRRPETTTAEKIIGTQESVSETEKKVSQTQEYTSEIQEKVLGQNILGKQECTLEKEEDKLEKREYLLYTQGNKLDTQGNKSDTQENKLETQENKLETQENNLGTQRNNLERQQNNSETLQNNSETQQKKLETQQNRSKTQDNNLQTAKNISETHENVLKTQGQIYRRQHILQRNSSGKMNQESTNCKTIKTLSKYQMVHGELQKRTYISPKRKFTNEFSRGELQEKYRTRKPDKTTIKGKCLESKDNVVKKFVIIKEASVTEPSLRRSSSEETISIEGENPSNREEVQPEELLEILSETESPYSSEGTVSCIGDSHLTKEEREELEEEDGTSESVQPARVYKKPYRRIPCYFYDFKEEDMDEPILVQRYWTVTHEIHEKMEKKVKSLQQQCRRLEVRLKKVTREFKEMKEEKEKVEEDLESLRSEFTVAEQLNMPRLGKEMQSRRKRPQVGRMKRRLGGVTLKPDAKFVADETRRILATSRLNTTIEKMVSTQIQMKLQKNKVVGKVVLDSEAARLTEIYYDDANSGQDYYILEPDPDLI